MIFEQVSGLKVNFNKSLLTGVNVSTSWLHEDVLVLHCHVGNFPFVYLGLPMGRDPRKLDYWKPIMSSIISRLSSWKSKFLSFGRPLILLKSLLSSLPVYFLFFFKDPAGNFFFWWGGEDFRIISWVDWDSVCLPREEGGLGVRWLRAFNVSLLGKWCWRMLVNKEGLWYRVLQARYGEEGGRLKEVVSQSK
jgi:hypothetical protein